MMTTFLYTNIALLDITTKEQSTSYKIQQCTKGTKYFEERLGLAFKKVDGECFSFLHFNHTTGFENCIFVHSNHSTCFPWLSCDNMTSIFISLSKEPIIPTLISILLQNKRKRGCLSHLKPEN